MPTPLVTTVAFMSSLLRLCQCAEQGDDMVVCEKSRHIDLSDG